MAEMKEELAVIENIDFGCRDTGRPCLWFEIKMLHDLALCCLEGQDALDFVRESGVYSIRELEGRPCVAEGSDQMAHFKRLL